VFDIHPFSELARVMRGGQRPWKIQTAYENASARYLIAVFFSRCAHTTVRAERGKSRNFTVSTS
jgi:hypothetical protein